MAMILEKQLCVDDYRALMALGCDIAALVVLVECAECQDEFAPDLPGQTRCMGCTLQAQENQS